jgi:endonuclease YncB( thermonuclease family)
MSGDKMTRGIAGFGFSGRTTVLKGRRLLYPLIALAFLTTTVPAIWADSRSLVATVQRVSDGNRIIAMTADGTTLRVRLFGIDAPEIPHGNKPGHRFGPLDTGGGER